MPLAQSARGQEEMKGSLAGVKDWASCGLGNLAEINRGKASTMPGILPRVVNNLSVVWDHVNLSFGKRKNQES